ncbi:MAG: hypothetical protein ABJC61_07885 [Acidobacteriota bacterium]
MNVEPAVVLVCPVCGEEKAVTGPLDRNAWHPVDCAANAGPAIEDHRYWWRLRSNPMTGGEALLEYSTLDPEATPDPKTAH